MDAQDFLTGSDGDLIIGADGDFVVGLSDGQHIEAILIAAPGDYKQSPLLGVNIQSFLNSPATANTLRRAIQLQLESDGYSITDIKFNEINPTITAQRIA